jgi:hypothetical protein
MKKLAVFALVAGCANSPGISPDPDVKDMPAETAPTDQPTETAPTAPTSGPGVLPTQLEVREVSCELKTAANGTSGRYAEALYPGQTKYQLLDSVKILVPGTYPTLPAGYDDGIPSYPFVKDGAALVSCGTNQTKIVFVRRL